MFRKRWGIWLAVFVALAALGALWHQLIPVTDPGLRGLVKGGTLGVCAVWLLVGFWSWFTGDVARRVGSIVLGSAAVVGFTGVTVVLFSAARQFAPKVALLPIGLTAVGWEPLAIAVAGAWVMAVMFSLGLLLLRGVFAFSHPIAGVARTAIDEAIRMKIALIFVGMLLLLVPLLPSMGDPQERLSYRIQAFISYSLTSVTVLLALMTVFLSCSTICSEISKKQIFLSMTKPLSRGGYLVGKWLGIMGMNLLLMAIAGLGVWVFAQAMERQRAIDDYDRYAIRSQVLVARDQINPEPADTSINAIRDQHIVELRREVPSLFLPGGQMTAGGVMILETRTRNSWYAIPANGERTYRFPGVNRAKKFGETVQLRVRARSNPSPPDNRVPLLLWVNDRPYNVDPATRLHMPVPVVYNQTFVIDIPIEIADKDGNLDLKVANWDPQRPTATSPFLSINMMPGDGLQVLYAVGSFESNLARSLLVIWIFLGFLSITGLAAGTFLGFPIACLFAMVMFLGTLSSGFLAEANQSFGMVSVQVSEGEGGTQFGWSLPFFWIKLKNGELWECFKMVMRAFSLVVVYVLPNYGELDPVQFISDGLTVSNKLIQDATLKIGLVAGGITAVIGWLIFRARELARVIV